MKKIGIIGCGTIGTGIAEYIQKKLKRKAKIIALCDSNALMAWQLSRRIKPRPIVTDIDELIKRSDLIIESASVSVSGQVAKKAVLAGKDVLIMSTGGLLKKAGLFKKAKLNRCNIYIPSGAICGMDGLRSAMIGRIKKVVLTTRKPPRGLKGAPYLMAKGIDVDGIKKETVVFEGNAGSAIKYFPQNVNVAATLSLSGIGPRRTRVRIVTSPKYKRNTHEIEVEGEFGKLWTRTENVPSKNNPKTSQLAVFSAMSKLKEIL